MKMVWTSTASKTPPSPKLSYETSQERDIRLKAVAENCEDMLPAQDKLTNTNHLQCGPENVSDFTPI